MGSSHIVRSITCMIGVFILVAGCTDTETIFVERPLFDDPPAAAAGFLGYGTVDAQTESFTTCGNCHIGVQSEWVLTNHSGAWATLQANSHAAPFCEGCHTVSEVGNAAEGDVAWNATADPRYQDVQCESCHGPGAGHIANPGGSQPLASIKADVDLENGCGECHEGSHHGFVDEWAQSQHGPNVSSAYARGRVDCQSCHEARAALQAFGVDSEYLEKDGAENLPIVCAVCHDPHSTTNEHQLRFPINVTDVENNLCMKCHHKRAVPDTASSRGPHSPQGPLLLGEEVGWTPPNFDTNIVRGTHGSAQNEELCVTCHLFGREITDPITGDFVLSSKGHLFKPIPCLDAVTGVPLAADCDVADRSFASCTGAGCHGDETVARSLYSLATARIAGLVADLDVQLAGVPVTEFDETDGILTVGEGATFNAGLGDITSSAIHNPFLTEALLLGSMQAVLDEYGIAPRILPSELAVRLSEITR